jgi:hypothetical protein
MPQISTVGLQEASRTSETLARKMDQVSNFAFRQAEQAAKEEGRRYGALNAPTTQQLEDAIAAGEDVSELVPGDTGTTFGRAARGTALKALATRFETNARQEITNLQAQFENEEIGLADFEESLTALVGQQTDVLGQASPIAAQQFSAATGVVANSAYLSAAKTQAQRNRTDYEISLRSNMDTLVRNAETIVRAGPTIDENGEVVTVDQKVNMVRDELRLAAQEIDDPSFYQAKLDELNEAVTQAKVGVVMDEAMLKPARAFRILTGEGTFEDEEVQATFESMSASERRILFGEVNTALADKDARDRRADARNDRRRAERSEELQARVTAAMLDGDDDAAEAALSELRTVDPSAWEQKSEAYNTEPGQDRPDTVVRLRRLSLNSELTQQDVDRALADGELSLQTYKTFMTDLEQQRNQRYNKAIDWLKSNRGVPEGTLINYTAVQRAADREVAQIKTALLDALNEDPSLDPYTFVQNEVQRLEQQGGETDALERKRAESFAAELRALLNEPNATAQDLYDELSANPDIYPNERLREDGLTNLLPLLIKIEEQQ